ncbi:MAG: DNA-binding response regulator [Cyanobacteria bacterium QS_8_64_29]|nr:MAG: DNA-binding response regulator [Cyanobacteria bacterium QS_8_64_29]
MQSLQQPQQLAMDSGTVPPGQILLIEDEALIREMVATALEEQGHTITAVADSQAAFDRLRAAEPAFDLLVLDLMLPQADGLEICQWLRYQSNAVPILILSAKASEGDRVGGLQAGADDYVTKPFSLTELVARCNALLRRQQFLAAQQPPVLQHRDIRLFPNECRVTVGNQELALSRKEFQLLEALIETPRRVWSREQLLERIWGPHHVGNSKTVDVHVRWLRAKLEPDPSHPQYVVTVRGFGYRLD